MRRAGAAHRRPFGRIGISNALFLSVIGPGTALDTLDAALGVDSGLLSGGELGHKRLSAGSCTGQPGRSGRLDPSWRAPDAAGRLGPGRRLNAKLERKSGRLQRLPTRWRPRWRTGLQTQMCEDALDDRRLQDRSDDLQLAAAIRALLQSTPGNAMSHIAILEALDGKTVDWLEHVTDEQYQASRPEAS
jgi:hypothetical protein